MIKSKEMSKKFYGTIKGKGLSKRTQRRWDSQIIKALKHKINKKQRVLDVGCGYGRITVPLAKQGYDIEGVDLSPALIKDAKRYAADEKVKVRFKVGDMCDLPYKENSFDAILCLWSAFNELLRVKEQIQAVKSMKRVLKKGGWALIESPLHQRPAKKDDFCGYGNRIRKDIIEGIKNYHYNHDKKSFTRLMKKANLEEFKICIEKFAGRNRLFLFFKR